MTYDVLSGTVRPTLPFVKLQIWTKLSLLPLRMLKVYYFAWGYMLFKMGMCKISKVSHLGRLINISQLGHVLRSESLLCTVLEGRMEGTRTRGRQSDTMIDWMKSNDVEYEHIKKTAYDREDWHHWRPGPA